MPESQQLSLKVAVLGSYTVELLAREIQRTIEKVGIHVSLFVGGFNQYRQDLLNPQSAYYEFAPDVTLLALDSMDLFPTFFKDAFELRPEQKDRELGQTATELEALLESNARTCPQNHLFVSQLVIPPRTLLGPLAWNSDFSIQEYLSGFNRRIAGKARQIGNCRTLDFPSLALHLGYERWFDPRLWYLARCRLGKEAMAAAAQQFASIVSALYRGRRKCLVLDLDNTLWGGVVGTESIEELQLGNEGIGLAFQEFQQLILELKRQGIVLAINSKNNYDESITIIENHPAMVLRKRDFAAIRINWSDKVTNMREIAEELGLGLESLVYFDDDPFQRNLLATQLPEVMVIEVPKDPTRYCATLLCLDCFWSLSLTQEDRGRAQLYANRAERERLRTTSDNLEDFYRSLEMKLKVRMASEDLVPRISQLTQRTNQFNLTSRRYDASAIRKFLLDPNVRILTAELADRFGSEGMIAVVILRRNCDVEWCLDTFLMSCRVIGRTVENALLAVVGEEVRRLGGKHLVGRYLATARNACVAGLYPSLGFQATEEPGCWMLDLERQAVPAPKWIEVELSNEIQAASMS